MTLDYYAVKWAIHSAAQHSDGDLFPKILEFEAVVDAWKHLASTLSNADLSRLDPGPSRRFIVPKDEISYRQATQLDPQDSIILSALLYQHGQGIENRRLPRDIIYSYRFGPTKEHGLYDSQSAWNEFWSKARALARRSAVILYCDIADFYNQIYHHTIENQLIESGFPNQAMKWIIRLIESTTAGVSRGVPIGPHSIHIIAEASLIPVDNTFVAEGFRFLRFADDILIFCDSREEAKMTLGKVADILDKQQRLMLQRHKTKFLTPRQCVKMCNQMVEDRPISRDEKEMLAVVRKYSGGNPYRYISYSEIDPEDWMALTDKKVSSIIEEYMSKKNTDYIRLRWFYRRLAQIGHPGAVRVSLENINRLGPCFANICAYLASVQNMRAEGWMDVGQRLLDLLEDENVKVSEFFRLSILSLFTRNANFNHFSSLSARFSGSDSNARREVLLAAYRNGAVDWVRGHKESFGAMDDWQKRAFIFCSSRFPADERKYFLRRVSVDRPFDDTLKRWAGKGKLV